MISWRVRTRRLLSQDRRLRRRQAPTYLAIFSTLALVCRYPRSMNFSFLTILLIVQVYAETPKDFDLVRPAQAPNDVISPTLHSVATAGLIFAPPLPLISP